MAKNRQLSLVPPAPPEQELREIPLDDLLKAKTVLLGPPPDHSFIESIRMWGVREPIKLTPKPRGGYKIEDGYRRLGAVAVLREQQPPEDFAGDLDEWLKRWSSIPAFVLQPNAWHDGIFSVMLNAQRSENPQLLLQQLEQLTKEGRTASEIYEATGVPVVTINRVLQLSNLLPELRAGFMAGEIVESVARAAAKCSVDQQEKLVEIYQSESQLTASDVREVKKADARAAQGALSGLGEDGDPDWWIDEVRRKLGECLEIVPEGDKFRDLLRMDLDALDDRETIASSEAQPDSEASNVEQLPDSTSRDWPSLEAPVEQSTDPTGVDTPERYEAPVE